MKSKQRTIVAIVVTIGLGYGAGAAVAGGEEKDAPRPSAGLPKTYEEALPPYDVLENGKTVGAYRLTTPLAERPDFVRTRTREGKDGLLRTEDFDPRTTQITGSDAVTELDSDDWQRELSSAPQPNEKGETWAPVYDPQTGSTVIGKTLLDQE